ncbi:hypothetical protein Lser_V15G08902 [Lactuca serriola]
MNSRIAFLVSSTLVICLITTTISAFVGGNETDYQALLQFKSMITHDPYDALSSWNTSFHFCNWSGVSCGKQNKRVTALELISQGLKGRCGIPPDLGNITSMEEFTASGNPLGGSIPDTLGRWKSLTSFYLGDCNLSGTIPHSIFNLSLLTNFTLAENQLTGSLPPAIGEMLPNLERLQLRQNQLTGPLPPSLSNCSKFRILEVNFNSFSGKLTIDFAKLKHINYLFLAENTFGFGEADDMKFFDSLKNCSRLTLLYLDDCQFQGVLPTSIGNLSDQLSLLLLGENHFYGNLPSGIGNLVGLTLLSLRDNQFTGKIPSTIDWNIFHQVWEIAIIYWSCTLMTINSAGEYLNNLFNFHL